MSTLRDLSKKKFKALSQKLIILFTEIFFDHIAIYIYKHYINHYVIIDSMNNLTTQMSRVSQSSRWRMCSGKIQMPNNLMFLLGYEYEYFLSLLILQLIYSSIILLQGIREGALPHTCNVTQGLSLNIKGSDHTPTLDTNLCCHTLIIKLEV